MDWVRFLDENNIHYVTRGPNTKRGEISIKCPMCGNDDPSEHLGINLTSGFWGCHRNGAHRGKSSRYLIKWILGCSSHQAQLVLRQYDKSDPDSLDEIMSVISNHFNAPLIEKEIRLRTNPKFKDFRRIKPRGLTKKFFSYIQDRGYDDPQEVIEHYQLRCSMVGRYKDRVIIPVSMNGEMLGWTSRSIVANPINAPRYLTSSEDIKTVVFNYDELSKGGERLFIVEGPFDAIKVDSAGIRSEEVKYRATCTFGTSFTVSQIAILRALVKKFKQAFVLFDEGADAPSRDLAEWIGCKNAYLPSWVKDPGEFRSSDLYSLGAGSFDGSVTSFWYDPYFQHYWRKTRNRP